MAVTPSTAPSDVGDNSEKTASATMPLSLAEFKLLLRLRELRKQIQSGRVRIELELDATQTTIIDSRPLRCEVFA